MINKKDIWHMNKKVKLLCILMASISTIILSGIFLNSINKFFRVGISILLIIEVICILKYTISTYDRNSLDDFWCGVRFEIFLLCAFLVFWAFLINFM